MEKLGAAVKIGKGVAFGCSAAITACGMGLVGGFLRNRHMMGQAGKMAQIEFKEAEELIKEGLADWRKA